MAVSTMKYALFCINTLFCIIGCVLVGIGAYIKQSEWLSDTYGDGVNDIAIALIVLGVMTMIISMVGCIGARDMNQRALLAYMVITFILLMCELGFAIDVIETTSSADVYNVCMKADTPAVAIDPATGKTFDCTGFATNTFRLGSYLVWQFLWNEGQLHYEATLIETGEVDADGAAIMGTGTSQQRKSYELAAGFQEEGRCCGFGAPIEGTPSTYVATTQNRCNEDTFSFEVNGNSVQHQLCYGYPIHSNPEHCLCAHDAAFVEATGASLCTDNAPDAAAIWPAANSTNPGLRCQYGKVIHELADGADLDPPVLPKYEGLYCAWLPGTDGNPVDQCTNALPTAKMQADMFYDFPLGACSEQCVPWGCGQVMYEFLAEKMIALGTALLFVCLLNFIGFAISVCLVCAHRAGVGKKKVVTNGKGTEMV